MEEEMSPSVGSGDAKAAQPCIVPQPACGKVKWITTTRVFQPEKISRITNRGRETTNIKIPSQVATFNISRQEFLRILHTNWVEQLLTAAMMLGQVLDNVHLIPNPCPVELVDQRILLPTHQTNKAGQIQDQDQIQAQISVNV